MNRRTLTTWLSALLLLLAGVASTSHEAPSSNPEVEPCHEMAESGHGAHHGHAMTADGSSDQDCLNDCQCCPGSCSGSSALTAAQWLHLAITEEAFPAYTSTHPHATQSELLRPPTAA